MNTVMKSPVHCDVEFVTEADWSTLMVKIKRMLSEMIRAIFPSTLCPAIVARAN